MRKEESADGFIFIDGSRNLSFQDIGIFYISSIQKTSEPDLACSPEPGFKTLFIYYKFVIKLLSQMDKPLKILLLLCLIILALYIAKGLFIPITIASLLSFLFLPLTERLERLGIGKMLSILICLLIILTIIFGLVFLFSSQLVNFLENLPALEDEAKNKFQSVLRFIESITQISYEKQKEWIADMNKDFSIRTWIQDLFFATTTLFLDLGLIIVYIFCFLYYRNRFLSFFISLFSKEQNEQVKEVLLKIRKLSSRYFSGILTVIAILGTMHSIGLLILGIEHAIFLGYLASMFSLVPVVGTMIGSTLPFLIALLTKQSIWYAVGVAAIFSFNLFVESQVLTPLIVGSHIRINPMAVIIAIVIGSFIWGPVGMVLFIPLVGMLKIVSDNVESLYPLKIFLSDENEEKKPPGILKKIKRKSDLDS
jgi:predicted PurR-regulated permease PerM